MLNAARRLSAGSALSDSLRYTSSSWRFFSTSFREERDTFGPILVPSDKFVLFSLYFSIFACLIFCLNYFTKFFCVKVDFFWIA